jgi:hypothetical protein
MPNFRPRISILTALLLTAILGMAIVLVQLWRSVEPLRAENRRLRSELGYLSILDENKVYATEVASDEPDTHRYRVYIPKKGTFKLHTRIFSIPGRPTAETKADWIATLLKSRSGSSSEIAPGEYTIDVKLRRNLDDEESWTMFISKQGKSAGSVGSKMPWLNDRRAWSYSSDVSASDQIEADPNAGLVLFKIGQATVTGSNGSYSMYPPDETKDHPGVMLWIAPASQGE